MRKKRGRPELEYCHKCSYYRKATQYYKLVSKQKKKGGAFFKRLVFIVVGHGMGCVTMSYVLAWKDHMQVVEGLSSTIITEIVAPIVIYGFTKTVENIFQKNRLTFSEPIDGSKKNEMSAGAEKSEELG